MKNENAFNAYLSKEFRARHSKGIYHTKVSDKFTAGISDFLLWGKSLSAAAETKLVKTLDLRPDTILLKHPFSGAQLTFLESIWLTGNPAWGIVGVVDSRSIYVIEGMHIPKNGNWLVSEFKNQPYKKRFEWDDIDGLLDTLLRK